MDLSGSISGPGALVVENDFVYPYGTSEQFPNMVNSDEKVLSETAHYYMECSNKGVCDRSSGECQCYDGYDGVACQRASCPGYPNSCSGHGVCMSIKQLAAADYGNVYELWDKDSTMGCYCDSGYFGPDCSFRQCKSGVDPLYLDDVTTIKYSIFDIAILTDDVNGAIFTDGQSQSSPGNFAIRFYDSFGEDWLTEPIQAGASCSDVIAALESLPNTVVPAGLTQCTLTYRASPASEVMGWSNYDAQHPLGSRHAYIISYNMSIWEAQTYVLYGEISPQTAFVPYESSFSNSATLQLFGDKKLSGYIYRIKFYGNPGALKQPQVELYLDGKRPSLATPSRKVITKVWTDGQQGEDYDYIADHCDGVAVNVQHKNGIHFLTGFSNSTKNVLKTCLGSADFDTSNNVGVYNWDYGSYYYPHLIKLVRTVTTYNDGGYYAAVYYDPYLFLDNVGEGTFRLLNPFSPPDALPTDVYEVYTSQGVLALSSNFSQAAFGFASNYVFTVNITYDLTGTNTTDLYMYDGDISCEVTNTNGNKFQYVQHCLNKGDMFTLLDFDTPSNNPPHINLYTAEKLASEDPNWSVGDPRSLLFGNPQLHAQTNYRESHYLTNVITTDISTNWGASLFNPPKTISNIKFHVYKFFPSVASTYNYVAPCSNRGICDNTAGTCNCFAGYTADDCSEQSSLAI